MNLVVADGIFEVFPEVRIGVLVARGMDNGRNDAKPQALSEMLVEAQESVRSRMDGVNVAEHPHIACWREAYRAFGAKPKKYPSSIENLVRRTLKGDSLRPINTLVDLYNVVSLRYLLPAGGEDLDRVEGDIHLMRADGSEPPVRLLGEAEARAPKAGEVIYRDDVGAICRRWNWKEADRTKLTEETTNAVLVIETLPPVTPDALGNAIEALTRLTRDHTGARVTAAVLDRGRRETALS